MPITLRQLRDILAVIESGSFRAAAEHLHAQQSAISRSILEFEASVGAKIFDRHPTGARLSPLGTQLAPDIKAIIDAVDVLSTKVASISRSKEDQFVLGLDEKLPIPLIQPLMVAVRAYIEHAQITLVQRDAGEIIRSVGGRQIQLGLICERQLPSDVSFRRLLVGELLAAVPDDGQIEGDVINQRVLLDQRLHIARNDVFAEEIAGLREILGADLNVTIHDCNPAGLISLVASGLGTGLLTVPPAEATRVGVKIVRVEPTIPVIGVMALWSTAAPLANLKSLFDRLDLTGQIVLAQDSARRSWALADPRDAGSG